MAKIDCSVTVNFIHESKRMCEYYRHDCDSCPMSIMNNGYDRLCTVVIEQHPDRAIKIVQEWSDEHPTKTRLDDLLEKYPKYRFYENDRCPTVHPSVFGYCNACAECRNKKQTLRYCWNEPVDSGATGKAVE